MGGRKMDSSSACSSSRPPCWSPTSRTTGARCNPLNRQWLMRRRTTSPMAVGRIETRTPGRQTPRHRPERFISEAFTIAGVLVPPAPVCIGHRYRWEHAYLRWIGANRPLIELGRAGTQKEQPSRERRANVADPSVNSLPPSRMSSVDTTDARDAGLCAAELLSGVLQS